VSWMYGTVRLWKPINLNYQDDGHVKGREYHTVAFFFNRKNT